jgi:hypothetical protein
MDYVAKPWFLSAGVPIGLLRHYETTQKEPPAHYEPVTLATPPDAVATSAHMKGETNSQ